MPRIAMQVSSHIRGEWLPVLRASPCFSPADPSMKVADVAWADAAQATAAMDAADAAFPSWRRTPAADRHQIISRLICSIDQQSSHLADLIHRENGKTPAEARREVASSLGEARFQAAFLEQGLVESSGDAELRHEPLGVVLLITPWNFPLTTVVRKAIPALLCGNTAVLKPSPQGIATAAAFMQLARDAGLPDGVLNLVPANAGDAIDALVDHPALRAISFTGSTGVGQRIAARLGSRDVRYQAEMGGCNAMVVWRDADLDAAAAAAASSGFAVCGQWCTGLSRLLVHEEVHDAFLHKLRDRVAAIRRCAGPGRDPDASQVTMGSLTTPQQLDRTRAIVANAVGQGAVAMVADDGWSASTGLHHPPVILHEVTPQMDCAHEELFAPIIAVMRCRDADEALRIVNDSRYGLSFSIYTRDSGLAERFMDEVEAGVCHVNLETWHRTPDLPVCGWKDSGRGIPESGRTMRDFLTRLKVVYRRSPS
jgi:aldehyde dehydrogenase (NAD+)